MIQVKKHSANTRKLFSGQPVDRPTSAEDRRHFDGGRGDGARIVDPSDLNGHAAFRK